MRFSWTSSAYFDARVGRWASFHGYLALSLFTRLFHKNPALSFLNLEHEQLAPAFTGCGDGGGDRLGVSLTFLRWIFV